MALASSKADAYKRFTFTPRFLWLQLNSSSEGLSRLQSPDPADLSLHNAVTTNLWVLFLPQMEPVRWHSTENWWRNSLPLALVLSFSPMHALSPSHYLPPPLLPRVKGSLYAFFPLNSREGVKRHYRGCVGLTPGTHTPISPTKTDPLH